ncbi:hypothetical protein F2Q70_00043854 [Brassica cretica]|uniref:PGG domain-containing protein n=2 Tax=Brassica cretica TaxID=69181 RepID=A0A8S9KPP4_BRACR|nr:hypothetical protein F2Q70_00043854 [Brassica cretica]
MAKFLYIAMSVFIVLFFTLHQTSSQEIDQYSQEVPEDVKISPTSDFDIYVESPDESSFEEADSPVSYPQWLYLLLVSGNFMFLSSKKPFASCRSSVSHTTIEHIYQSQRSGILGKENFDTVTCRTLAEYLSNNLSMMEKRNNLLGLSNLSMTGKTSPNTSERRDALLVVAILIATATYQAGLSPPGGFWQENSSNPNDGNGHKAGQMTMVFKNAIVFIVLNGLAFLSSLFVIIILVMELPMWKLLYGSVAALSVAMSAAYITIFPNPNGELEKIQTRLFIMAFPVMIGAILYNTFIAFTNDKESRHKVDFQASYFSSSYSIA